MVILGVTAAAMLLSGAAVWFALRAWVVRGLAPRIDPGRIRRAVRRHPKLAAAARTRLDPTSLTGLALTAALTVVVLGGVGFGALLLIVRENLGFARFDLWAAHFAAKHADPASTDVLRTFSQVAGTAVLAPLCVVVALIEARRRRFVTILGFLVLCVGGQVAVVDLIKWVVDRTRPNFDRLTGFSGGSFPSGHSAAAAATFAAFALLAGIGKSSRVQTALAAGAVAIAIGVGCTRVFLGVHWLTDVLAGLAVGWAWFALCSIAFGGRLLRFGAPVEQAKQATPPATGAADPRRDGVTPAEPRKLPAVG
jgi:undecaprenyl-diphosphatase